MVLLYFHCHGVPPITKFTELSSGSRNSLPKGCNVSHLNARSIKNKVEEINAHLCKFDIDVLAITETWLTPSIEDACVNIENYNLSRLDRQIGGRKARGGGLMVFTKKKYDVNDTKFNCLNRSNQNIEAQVIEISKSNFKTIVIANIYRPPGGAQQAFITEINEILDALDNL